MITVCNIWYRTSTKSISIPLVLFLSLNRSSLLRWTRAGQETSHVKAFKWVSCNSTCLFLLLFQFGLELRIHCKTSVLKFTALEIEHALVHHLWQENYRYQAHHRDQNHRRAQHFKWAKSFTYDIIIHSFKRSQFLSGTILVVYSHTHLHEKAYQWLDLRPQVTPRIPSKCDMHLYLPISRNIHAQGLEVVCAADSLQQIATLGYITEHKRVVRAQCCGVRSASSSKGEGCWTRELWWVGEELCWRDMPTDIDGGWSQAE